MAWLPTNPAEEQSTPLAPDLGGGAGTLTGPSTIAFVAPAAATLPTTLPPPPWIEVTDPGKSRRSRGLGSLWVKIAICVAAVLAVALAAVAIFDRTQHGTVLPGVTIDGVAVGGLSEADARAKVDDRLTAASATTVDFTGDTDKFPVTLGALLGLHADVDDAIARALRGDADTDPGKSASLGAGVAGPFVRTWHRLLNKPVDADVEVGYAFAPDKVDAYVKDVQAKLDRPAIDAKIDTSNKTFKITGSQTGRQVQADQLKADVEGNARAWALAGGGAVVAAIPVNITTPAVTEQTLGKTIFVNKADRKLYLYNGATLEVEYRVAIGTPGHPTPSGTFKIDAKRKNPTWVNPDPTGWGASMPKSIGPGPSNPLGTRALNLNASGIRIHGTNNVGSIGSAASHGCMRMVRSDVEALFEKVDVGTRVVIV